MTFDFGRKEKNPFDDINFFPKPSGDKKLVAKRIKLSEVSSFLPEKFQETVMRVYWKGSKHSRDIDRAQRFVLFCFVLSELILVANAV